MERLTLEEAIAHAKEIAEKNYRGADFESIDSIDDDIKTNCIKCAEEHLQLVKWLEELKSYEDLEEQGLLVRFPCKVGDDIYRILSKANYDLNVLNGYKANNRVYHQKVYSIVFSQSGWFVQCDKDSIYAPNVICVDVEYGKTWFLTVKKLRRSWRRGKTRDRRNRKYYLVDIPSVIHNECIKETKRNKSVKIITHMILTKIQIGAAANCLMDFSNNVENSVLTILNSKWEYGYKAKYKEITKEMIGH